MRRLRGCVYGCGMISEFHLRGWARIPEVDIVGLGDRDMSRARDRAEMFAPAAHVYEDLETMLRSERPDFLDVLTPPDAHPEHCRIGRAAGVHVICQKPLAGTLEEARAIVAEFAGSDRLLAVHENHRFRPWFQKALKHDYGRISFARFEHLNATEPGESYKNDSPAGVFLEYASHLVDMMRCILGDPLRVYARMHRVNPRVRGESLAHAVYEYPEATAVIDAGWKDGASTQGSVLLLGSECEAFYEGTLTRGDSARLRITRGQDLVLDNSLSPYDEYAESFYLLQREFADAVLGRRRAVTQTGAGHLVTLACTLAAYESALTGRIVELSGADQNPLR